MVFSSVQTDDSHAALGESERARVRPMKVKQKQILKLVSGMLVRKLLLISTIGNVFFSSYKHGFEEVFLIFYWQHFIFLRKLISTIMN